MANVNMCSWVNERLDWPTRPSAPSPSCRESTCWAKSSEISKKILPLYTVLWMCDLMIYVLFNSWPWKTSAVLSFIGAIMFIATASAVLADWANTKERNYWPPNTQRFVYFIYLLSVDIFWFTKKKRRSKRKMAELFNEFIIPILILYHQSLLFVAQSEQ